MGTLAAVVPTKRPGRKLGSSRHGRDKSLSRVQLPTRAEVSVAGSQIDSVRLGFYICSITYAECLEKGLVKDDCWMGTVSQGQAP